MLLFVIPAKAGIHGRFKDEISGKTTLCVHFGKR